MWPVSPLVDVTPGPRVIVVRNDDDSAMVRGYLKSVDDIRYRQMPSRCTLVRPTPEAADRDTFALDLLAAVGKNPETLAAERLGTTAWNHARAWLAAAATSDLVIDRAHRLAAEQLGDLATLAAWLGCRVWLIWSGGGELHAAFATAHTAGVPAASILPDLLRHLLPLPPSTTPAVTRFEDRVLPTAEFTTFRAACRRLLSPREFAHVDQLYLEAASRADLWMRHQGGLREQGLQGFGGALAAWLRDVQLGPHTHPGTALITLRATQAALFIRGVLLRWNPTPLGPDPAGRLCGTIDARHCPHHLYAGAKTAPAAITVLSLHLNQPPLYFNCWRIHHAARDGATLSAPGATHHHHVPQYLGYPDYRAAIAAGSGVEEIACAHTIRLPEPVRVILAAHRAYRLLQGASEVDPLFVAPRTGEQATYAGMRQTAIRTAERLHRSPPWLHRDPCRFGADIGLRDRVFGWLVERGLSVHLLDAELADRLHHPLRHQEQL